MNELELKNEQIIEPKEFDIDGYLAKRKEFIEKVNKIMHEGKDYHVIQGRKSLGKGGAEKIAAIFGWQASFIPDEETIKMLGTEKGVIAYICKLTKDTQFIGEGRGARSLIQDKGDINKAVKMSQKSAFVDSVLRASGLSDFFSQDLEDMELENPAIGQNNAFNNGLIPKSHQPTPRQTELIRKLAREKGLTQQEVIAMAEGRTPSDLIKALLVYQKSDNPEDLPEIQQEKLL